jgi:cytochrome P450
LEIEAHPAEFLNAPRSILGNKESDQRRVEKGNFLTTLVHMDDPEHRLHRNLTSEWFLPKNLSKLTSRLDDLAAEAVNKMEAAGGSCDFARDIAMPYPLQVILSILGLPENCSVPRTPNCSGTLTRWPVWPRSSATSSRTFRP